MNKNTRNILIAVGVYVVGYMIWKKYYSKPNAPTGSAPKLNEAKANAIGGGIVVPKGKKVELLQSAPGVCGYYYEGDDGDLVYVGPAQCPQAV